MNYRAEIDGLRAIAVIPVILFHADLLRGGFLGVDVFFVISGYLITGILLNQLQNSHFTFRSFYERRARRILPALLIITLVTVPFAMYYLNAYELKEYGWSLVAICFFVSNYLFWQERDYFAEPINEIPLLHTWSLAVEEQFYIIFPLILFLLWRYLRSKLLTCLFVAIALSLAISAYLSANTPMENFYLLPSRVWELMCGAVLAYLSMHGFKPCNQTMSNVLSLAGIVTLVCCFKIFQESFAHPGLITTIPIAATCLVIWFTQAGGIVQRILSHKILVGIGLISYSMYLWHLPLIVFSRIGNMSYLALSDQLLIIPVTIFLSYLSWRFVEMPFRNRNIVNKKYLLTSLISLTLVTLTIGFVLKSNTMPETDLPTSVIDHMKNHNKVLKEMCYTGTKTIQARPGIDLCYIGDQKYGKPLFVVWGNSHANVMYDALNTAANNTQVSGVFSAEAGCAPIFFYPTIKENTPTCEAKNSALYSFVRDHQIENLIIIARWDALIHNIYDEDAFKEYRGYIQQSIKAFTDIGVKVYILVQIPKQQYDPRKVYQAAYDLPSYAREAFIQQYSLPKYMYEQMKQEFYQYVKPENDMVILIDFTEHFCDDEVCTMGTSATSLYRDDDHIGSAGNRKLVDAWSKILQRMKEQ